MRTGTVAAHIAELIGDTPIVKLNSFNTGKCDLFIKLEYLNPGGSIKDRIALHMVEVAEKQGLLTAGGTIVEATAGNTGVALAMIAAIKGYQLVCVMPDKMSQEKVNHLKAFGADVIMTRSDVQKGHPAYYQELAKTIATERPNSFFIDQFTNPYNVEAHELSTAPEIWAQMQHSLDAIVLGAGTSGTVSGLSRYFRHHQPKLEMVLADPEGSILADYIHTDTVPETSGQWLVEGIGEDYLPSISDFSFVRSAFTISDKESIQTSHKLLKKEGIFAGSSTGTLVAAAVQYCQQQSVQKRVLTFACDTGNKYLSKCYNPEWLKAHEFI